jgi:hypothetical protein
MDDKIITHQFVDWKSIPDVSHLEKVKNSYIRAFKGDIVYVSYIIRNGKLTSFGSCGYYKNENYYGDDKTRQLWIEGMVSVVSGHGSIILKELENCLKMLAESENISHKIINVMSVDESIGFYEKNGYQECKTSIRFRGTGNTRLAKSIDGFSLESAELCPYIIAEHGYDWISQVICEGRIKILEDVMFIPSTVKYNTLYAYIINHPNKNEIFKQNIPIDKIPHIINRTLELYEEYND